MHVALGILALVMFAARSRSGTPAARHSLAGRALRNSRLLIASIAQHLIDDPVLLALQISRRLPIRVRTNSGRALTAVSYRLPGCESLSALGASMAEDSALAEHLLERASRERSHLHGELSVLLNRTDLLAPDAPASTRARALWSNGDLTGAITLLESSGKSLTPQARRLRSELQLLQRGHRLTRRTSATPPFPADRSDGLRVLHLITNSLPHTQSGYSLRTHNILKGLRLQGIESLALTRTGYPVMVGKPWCADEDVVDGIRYRRTLPSALGATPEARLEQEVDEAVRLVQEFRPNIIHATTDYRNALVAQAVSTATGIPWVFEVRGLMEMTWIASRPDPASQAAAEKSEKVRRIVASESSLAEEADAVVTLSRTMADVLVQRGVDPDRITLIPNGVDSTLLDTRLTPAEARTRLSDVLPADALAVGAVSALVDYEGHDTLLRAVAELLSDPNTPTTVREHLRVVLVGDGVAAPALRGLARDLGIAERLVMPGRVSRQNARIWVQALDVVAVPRKDYAVTQMVTPQKPAEALALGRPVVASDLPALRETMEDHEGDPVGVLVAPENPKLMAVAISNLMTDPARRERLAERGREAAANRTWGALMERYEYLYRSLLKKSNGRISRDA